VLCGNVGLRVSIGLGTLLCVLGSFRLWLLSVLAGQDVWVYLITQVTVGVRYFWKLGLLAQPSVFIIQVIAIALVFVSNLIYL